MRVARRFTLALTACSLLSGSLAASVMAEPGPAKAQHEGAVGPEEHARRLAVALKGLNGADANEIERALYALRELKGRAAAEAIAARLKSGLPPQLTELALDVAASLDQPLATPVLSELTLHRRWQIRAKAITALSALRVRSSVSVLLYALDDPSAEVRSAAARGLGAIGDPRALPALNAALARGVDGALEGLAGLATSKQVPAILERATSALKASEPALRILITRANLPLVTKLKVISFVQAHQPEAEAQEVLASWRDQLKQQGDLRLLAALTAPAKPSKPAPAQPAEAKPSPSEQKLSQVNGAKP